MSNIAQKIETGMNDMLDVSKEHILSLTVGTVEQLNDTLESYRSLSIDGIENVAAYREANTALKTVRKWRIDIESARKEITRPIDVFKKQLIEFEAELIIPIKQVEEHLKSDIQKIDDAKEAARKELILSRSAQLKENGFNQIEDSFQCGPVTITTAQISEFSDEEMDYYVQLGQKELARRKAEEERMQRERDELAQQRAELARELEELRALKAELAAQKQAMDKTYETVSAPEQPDQPEQVLNPEPVVIEPEMNQPQPCETAADLFPPAPENT
jgi:superfamily I DNA and/or RNA helicase